MKTVFLVVAGILLQAAGLAQDLVAPRGPDTSTRQAIAVNNLPPSEIDIPIRMDLRPVYEFANRFIDTLYTSPNYPQEWITDGCNLRYQYRFVRGPLQFRAVNNTVYISFSGYYGIRGSTRVCTTVGNSPWTPSCSCGFGTEKPRRIDAGFVMQLRLLPDYRLGVTVNRINPVPVDKCEVCFFGKDVTQQVAQQVRVELDASIGAFRKQLETFSFKPFLRLAWDSLQAPYPVPGFGYLQVQPSALRISQAILRRDSLYLSVGMSARPELKTLPQGEKSSLPNLTDFRLRNGFRLYLSQTLHYDSLSVLLNAQVAGREFVVGKGLFRKTVRVDSVRLQGGDEKMFIKVFVSKAARGVFYLEGKPAWDAARQQLYFDELDFHLESRQWLLHSASYLLDGTITQRLRQYSTFDLGSRVQDMMNAVARHMNRPLYPGVDSRGTIQAFSIDSMQAVAQGLHVQGRVEGKLWVDVDAARLLQQWL